MKKVLLVGEFNEALNAIYKSLQENYQVQLSKIDFTEVQGMVKMTEPNLVFINAQNVVNFERKILEYLQKINNRIPVLFVGTKKACEEYVNCYDDFFCFLDETVMLHEVLQMCDELLGETGSDNTKSNRSKNGWKKTVLIVDDSGVFLRSVKAILEPQYEVLIAKTGKKAMSVAEMEEPDLILLDYEMPGWNGRETLEKLRHSRKTAHIPVVFLTAMSDKSHILEVLKMQPQGYLLKPINSEELKEKIAGVIGK